ncbi:ThiJ PfpI family protein [Geosmithia morbida]|uniref:ThiJ PfpI family protein n=1 Tax=Geosmithia morbida TaxID=1094350 RepID=A0A9P4YN32_9HYPO|nr:ThiJ PfpI family protein [Geosmithia morbida]KAF4119487.1 ThiJ PfpI family protein [Geosmithia morbida]
MPATKTSAVADEQEPINVLFALHPKFDLLDFAGPVEVFSTALHDRDDPSSRAFEITLASSEPQVLSEQGIIVNSHITFKEAHDNLEDYDVLVVLGGNMLSLVKTEDQPAGLIVDFSELQKKEPARERTLLSVCTGSLLLAKEGILSGLSATTHPDFLTTFENLCSDAATRNLQERTDIVEDARYVVNNLRFDLDGEDSSPYIRRKSDSGRRPSNARKGSMSWKDSNSRRESIVRRAAMRLGGLRVITSGGNSAGIDAALYLVSAMVDEECAFAVSRMMQWNWTKGVVVDGLDV